MTSNLWNRVMLHRWQWRLKLFKYRSATFCSEALTSIRTFSNSSALQQQQKQLPFNLKEFPVEQIRNFSIIAHVDHGKSTLADRLLELTGTIPKGDNKQVLDRLQVERERGITVKAQTATLFHNYNGKDYLLNLIDTPGHVDFHYEVSRSLAACDGVILLIDANQGVQAQTVANFYLAFESELTIIPVLNKIDLKHAQPDLVEEQIGNVFDIKKSEILRISAKQAIGVEALLEAVINRIPHPQYDREKALRAFLFDSWYDQFKGVVAHVAICDGVISKGDKITCASSQINYEVTELGVMHPTQLPCPALYAGQVGYAMMNMRNTREAQIGDTFHHENKTVEPLPGFRNATPMVFAGMFPLDQSEFPALRNAIEKLTLNDRSVQVKMDSSPALGQGYRVGFLGLLHMDVFNQRLEQEFDASVVTSAPSVAYKVKIMGEKNLKKYGGEEVTVLNPCLMPSQSIITEFFEPMVHGTIISPADYMEDINLLCLNRRGRITDQSYIDDSRVMLQATFPLSEILVDFFDELKSMSSGYASFNYEDAGYESTELVTVHYLLNGREVEELTLISHISRARDLARHVCLKLKETIPRQQFGISIQGKVGSKVLAREDIKAYRKDVTAKLYGGDVTRKQKLLKQQVEGKKRLRKIGNIDVPRDAFIKILRK